MEKLMVLGAGPFQLPLITKAQEMGCYVIAITPDGNYPGIKVADKVYFHDAKDEEYALEVARKEQINGVISDQGDLFVRPVAYVAEHMGLPGNKYQTALTYTDKHLMREKSKELGLATIESTVVDTLDEAIEAFRALNGNAIIKPVDSSSSRGISKVTSEEELREKWDEAKFYSRAGGIIVEHFVEGPQFEVDSIAAGGHVYPLMYADLDEFDIPNVFSSRTRLYPSVADDAVVKKLLDYSQKINEGFGMYQGVSHNEYIMDEKTGEMYLIECGLRGGGTYIATAIAANETGVDTQEFLVNVALGRLDDVPPFEMNKCHSGYVAFYLPIGEVISTDGKEEVENLPYVDKTKLANIEVGQFTKAATDKNQRCAIILHADSREQMMERIEHIKSILNIQVKTDNGIEGPIW